MKVVLVVGCPRSGTTITARVLAAHGMWTGKVDRVLHENLTVREQFIKPYLRSINADPLGQTMLPARDERRGRYPLLRPILLDKLRSEQGLGDPDYLLIKEPKITLMWWIWYHSFPRAYWVIVRRGRKALEESINDTRFLRVKNPSEWITRHEEFLEDIESLTENNMEVFPEQFLYGDESGLQEVVEWLGMTYNPTHLQTLKDSSLYRKSR